MAQPEGAKGAEPRVENQGPAPLPEWPIRWSCVGIRIETLLPVDRDALVSAVNGLARPAFSMAVVDVKGLVGQEFTVEPRTELGEKLKAAQENPPPEGGQWLTPELVNMVLEARALKDRDEEHRIEAQRRAQYAGTCALNIEEARHKVTDAEQQLEDASKRFNDFEVRVKEAEAKQKILELDPTVITADAAAADAAMGGGTGSAKGSGKGSAKKNVKGSPAKGSIMGSASGQVLSPEQERKQLEDTILNIKALIRSCQQEVKVAKYLNKKQEAEKCDPLTTTRIYWCLGLGETAEALCQQATVKHMFKAIFNLAKKPLPPPPESNEPSQYVPVPPFINELRGLAQGSKLDHPSRKIPVVDVLYEDPPLPKDETSADPPAPSPGPQPLPIRGPPLGDIPYAMVAKAVVSGVIRLQQQLEAFSKLDASITTNYEIPEAIPLKDVNLKYYKVLLDAVPMDWVSIPVILHCIVEQVAYYDCPIEDMEVLEIDKCNQRLAEGFDAFIQRFGHGLSCTHRSSDVLNEIIEEIKAQQAVEDSETAEEILATLLKIANDEVERRFEEAEKLAAEAAAKLAEEEAIRAAAIAAGEISPSAKRKPCREVPGLKRLQESAMDGKKSFMEGRKPSAGESEPSATGIGGKKKSSQNGSSMMQRRSESPSHRARSSAVTAFSDPTAAEISELLKHSSSGKCEGHSLVHEFSRVGRLERTVKQKALLFLESVNVVEVEKRMLLLLGYPGKRRASMPKISLLSDENRGACLEALRRLVGWKTEPTKGLFSNFKETDAAGGRRRLVEPLWIPDRLDKIVPLSIGAVQRYKKLKMLLEIFLEEEKRAFNLTADSGMKLSEVDVVMPKEEPYASLIEEERKKLDNGNDFLADCGYFIPEKKDSPDAPPWLDQYRLSASSGPEEMCLPFQSITDRRFIEPFPDGLLGEIYGKARTRLPYRVCRYDRDEDCLVEALYADERDHVWQGVAASQIGFGDYVARMDNPSPAMLVTGTHATYDVPEEYATVQERFRCHLTEDQGLVWTGLPARTDIQWEPQTTVIKDGHMILLRADGPDDSSESPRVKCVYACLRDGLVVCFFIADDGTMTMQVTNPENQTIEITSMGIVRLFASHLHAKAEEIKASAGGEAPAEGGEAAAPPSLPPPRASPISPPLPPDLPPPPSPPEDKKQNVRDFLLNERSHMESWRCILPTGTVIRYMNNGDAQVLYRQGNVSDFRKEYEGGPCWITTNNEGFVVVQRDPPGEGEPPVGRGESPPPPPPEKKASMKKISLAKVVAELIPEEPVPEDELVDPNRPRLTQLPNLKVAHFNNPGSGDTITTREDLVVVINSETHKSTFVQHADGTQMYSEIIETYPSPERDMSQGEFMLDQIAQIFPKNLARDRASTPLPEPLNGEEIIVGAEKITRPAGAEERASLAGQERRANSAGAVMKKKKQSIPKVPRTTIRQPLLPHPPVLPDIATTWHVHKEGLAKVQGKIGSEMQQSGICVEFQTADGQYAATWSNRATAGKEACPLCHRGATLPSCQLSLSMPGGAILYAVGNAVSFDPSDGSKKKDPYQTEEDDRKHGPFVNTNGVYVFDVVEGSLLFTNNLGSGFKIFGRGTEWETVKGGQTATQAAQEAEIFKELLLQHAAAVPEGLQQDLYAREIVKNFYNDPLADPVGPPVDALPPDTTLAEPQVDSSKKLSFKKGTKPAPSSLAEGKGLSKKVTKLGSTVVSKDEEPLKKGSKLGDGLPKKRSKRGYATEGEGPPADPPPEYVPVDIFANFELTPLGERKQPPPGSLPTTPAPPPSHSPELEVLGPYPRIFVIHEGGHGYEFYSEEMYHLHEIAKFDNKLCTRNVKNYIKSGEDVVFHAYVTIENKNQSGLSELIKNRDIGRVERNFSLSHFIPAARRISLFPKHVQANHNSDKVRKIQTKCNWLQLQFEFPKLPHIINPIVQYVASKQGKKGLLYRQIVELPIISQAMQKKMDEILEEFLAQQQMNVRLQDKI